MPQCKNVVVTSWGFRLYNTWHWTSAILTSCGWCCFPCYISMCMRAARVCVCVGLCVICPPMTLFEPPKDHLWFRRINISHLKSVFFMLAFECLSEVIEKKKKKKPQNDSGFIHVFYSEYLKLSPLRPLKGTFSITRKSSRSRVCALFFFFSCSVDVFLHKCVIKHTDKTSTAKTSAGDEEFWM